MSAATLTSKGQTTIPKDIREGLSLKSGDKLDFHLLSNDSATIRVRRGTLDDFIGILHVPGRAGLSSRDVDTAIAVAMKQKRKLKRK